VAEDQRATQVIRRLGVLFKRGEPASFEPLDLNELARDTVEFTRNVMLTRNTSIVLNPAPELPRVEGDRVQLQQLLLNLIVNAADAMAELPEQSRVVTIDTSHRGDAVALCVTDEGPGVPADAKGKVFDPFWTTKPNGMGMGLAVCRSIAEAHRGTFVVTDSPAGGAEFCLLLPAPAVS
jgi:signal transduction histidine kinase